MLSFPDGWLLNYDKQDLKRFTHLTFLMVIALWIGLSTHSLSKNITSSLTKDSDFVESFLFKREPWKLLLVSTGNIGNDELESLLLSSTKKVVEGFETFDFIELSRTNVIFHL